jgi:hypothetical protein
MACTSPAADEPTGAAFAIGVSNLIGVTQTRSAYGMVSSRKCDRNRNRNRNRNRSRSWTSAAAGSASLTAL